MAGKVQARAQFEAGGAQAARGRGLEPGFEARSAARRQSEQISRRQLLLLDKPGLDEAPGCKPLENVIGLALAHAPDGAQLVGEALVQLIAVPRLHVEESEQGELGGS